MPVRLAWTPCADTEIRRLRAHGASWDRIAASLGVSRWSAIERGRAIGAPPPPPRPPAAASAAEREPLPPGHPVSWGAITAGTQAAGTPYPWPPLPMDGRMG
jgi:hypothetical protein